MQILSELVAEFDANAVVLADAGNGCAIGETGELIPYSEDIAEAYGDTPMKKLTVPHKAPGAVCAYASEWIIEGDGDNPYRVRIYF